MDADIQKFSFSAWAIIAVVIAVSVGLLIFAMLGRGKTVPRVSEGFGAPVVGAGVPDCLRESNEAAQIVSIFLGRVESVEEGAPDLEELKVILSKLACMKRDLVGVAQVVNATLYQPFVTAHDVEPVAETVGRCFAKTIPPRDLEISFDKWKTRGRFLINRLCGAAEFDAAQTQQVNALYNTVLVDVYDIAQQRCLKGQPEIMGKNTPRDVSAFSPPEIKDLREYTGYY
jgi:hypothetical protein